MLLKIRKNRVKIAGQSIRIRPMNAKAGLAAVIQFSSVMNQSIPYLMNLADKQRSIRLLALGGLLKDVEEIPDIIFEIVSLSTGLSRYELEHEATLKELFMAFGVTMKVNDWTKFWSAAYSLQIVNKQTTVAWAMSSLQRLVARG